MRHIFKLLAIFSILTLSACATFDNSRNRGYFESREISDNIYQVIAYNNKSNDMELMKTAAMFHAAQITLKHKKKRFIILNESQKTNKKYKIYFVDEEEIEQAKEDGYIIIDKKPKTIKTEIKSILLIEIITKKDPRYESAIDAAKTVEELRPIVFLNSEN